MEINKNLLKLIYCMFTINIDSVVLCKNLGRFLHGLTTHSLGNWAFPICFLVSFCYGSYNFPILFPFNQVSALLGVVQMNSCLIIRTSVGVAAWSGAEGHPWEWWHCPAHCLPCIFALQTCPSATALVLQVKVLIFSCKNLFLSLKWLLNAHFRQKSVCSFCIFHPFHLSPVLLCSAGWVLLYAVVLESVLQKQGRTGFCLPGSFRSGGNTKLFLKKTDPFWGGIRCKKMWYLYLT